MQGKGVEQDGVVVNERASFVVDARRAGTAALQVAVFDEDSGKVDASVRERSPAVYECSYTPRELGRHCVDVSYGHVAVPQSPFKVSHTHHRCLPSLQLQLRRTFTCAQKLTYN